MDYIKRSRKSAFILRMFLITAFAFFIINPFNPVAVNPVSAQSFGSSLFSGLDEDVQETADDTGTAESQTLSETDTDPGAQQAEQDTGGGGLWDFISNDLFSNLSFKADPFETTSSHDTLTANADAYTTDTSAHAEANADLATYDGEAKSGWTISWKDLDIFSKRSTDSLHADIGAHASANAGYDIGIPEIGYQDRTQLVNPGSMNSWKKDYFGGSEDQDGDGRIDNPFTPPNITLASASANAHADAGINVNYEHLDEYDVLGGLFYMDQKSNVDLFAGADANAKAEAGISTDFVGLNLGANAFAGARARVANVNTLGINRNEGGPSVSFGANAEGTAGAGAGANLILGYDREQGLMFSLGGKASAGLGLGAGFSFAINPGDRVNQVVYEGIRQGTENAKKLHGAIVEQTKATGAMIKDSFNNVKDRAKAGTAKTMAAVKKGADNVKKTAEKVKDKAQTVKSNISKAYNSTKKAVSSKVSDIKNNAQKTASNIKNNIASKANTAKKAVTQKVSQAKNTVSKAANTAKKAVTQKVSQAKNTVSKAANTAKKAVSQKVSQTKQTVSKAANTAKKTVSKAKSSVTKKASEVATSASGWFKSKAGSAKKFIGGLF
jgi:hypothetical protein